MISRFLFPQWLIVGLALAMAGCVGLTRRAPQGDPVLSALRSDLGGLLLAGHLPEEVHGWSATQRTGLTDSANGFVADYRQWLDYTRDYNQRMATTFGYHNLAVVNAATDDPIAATAELEQWSRQLVAGAGGVDSAFDEALRLLQALPMARAQGAEKHRSRAGRVRDVDGLAAALAGIARQVDVQALGTVAVADRELLQFVIPWMCRSDGEFVNRSNGAPGYYMSWGFYPCDPFEVGAERTSISGTPVPPALHSVTGLSRYLLGLAGQPPPAPALFMREEGEHPTFSGAVDFAAMGVALEDLSKLLGGRSLAHLNDVLSGLPGDGALTFPGVSGGLLALVETDYGVVLVGGPDANRYENVAALAIVDVGGDDTYQASASAGQMGRQPLAVTVDFAGDDVYETRGVGGPGAGILGISVLIDRAGNDRYCQGLAATFEPRQASRESLVAADPEGVETRLVPFLRLYGDPNQPEEPGVALHAGFAFGAGFLGVGVLVDEQGDDLYLGQKYAFGVGFWSGVGVLHDTGGDDVYAVGYAGLGVGINGASGVVDDRGGNDHYQCLGTFESSYSKGEEWDNGYAGNGIGFGSSWRVESRSSNPKRIPTLGGGVGLVHDAQGNDSYIGSSFGVAAGYAGGVGLVIDDAGEDTYFVKRGADGSNHSGWSGNHALGNGCHRGVGYLLDRVGDDRYSASSLGGGTAWDLGIGYLLDLGDDQMTDLHGKNNRGNTGWGAAKGWALSYHYGGRDIYDRRSFGNAASLSPGYPGVGGNFSFFFDVGPDEDVYPAKEGENWNDQARDGGIGWKDDPEVGSAPPHGLGLFWDGSDAPGGAGRPGGVKQKAQNN